MICTRTIRIAVTVLVWIVLACACNGAESQNGSVQYTLSLRNPGQHIAHVTINLSAGPDRRILQMPVWNALYQVRDFSQYLLRLSAGSPSGAPISLTQLGPSTWQVDGAQRGAVIQYDVFADRSGPYGAQINGQHAFLNLAQVFLYDENARGARVSASFKDMPKGWKFSRRTESVREKGEVYKIEAKNYDELVDEPVEAGAFREIEFEVDGGRYRILIDAEDQDYDAKRIGDDVQEIVREEVEWMNDRPCAEYTFLFHFPENGAGGGMEHACSSAIDVPASTLAADRQALDAVVAHEFFHLWNVKRIRPQSLEPIDYSKEQHTRALWFSEGVTSTIEDYVLLRAGFLTGGEYLRRLSWAINNLQKRSAHVSQSAEESSLSAWLEKYPFYGRPDRSISYYNKGEILGVMLDLEIREATHGQRSIQDVFRLMNEQYAKQGRFFPDSEGVRQAVEAVSGRDFGAFFEDYVAGHQEIDYDHFLGTVGLKVAKSTKVIGDLGFTVNRERNGFSTVSGVDPDTEAAREGIAEGDRILKFNGKDVVNAGDEIARMLPGGRLKIKVQRSDGSERELKVTVRGKEVFEYAIVERDDVTQGQRARRSEWLHVPVKTDGRNRD